MYYIRSFLTEIHASYIYYYPLDILVLRGRRAKGLTLLTGKYFLLLVMTSHLQLHNIIQFIKSVLFKYSLMGSQIKTWDLALTFFFSFLSFFFGEDSFFFSGSGFLTGSGTRTGDGDLEGTLGAGEASLLLIFTESFELSSSLKYRFSTMTEQYFYLVNNHKHCQSIFNSKNE